MSQPDNNEAAGAPAPPGSSPKIGPAPRSAVAVAFFFVLFTLAMAAMFHLLWSFVADTLLALLFTSFLLPLYRGLMRRAGLSPVLAASLVCLLLLVLVALPITIVAVNLPGQAASAYEILSNALSVERVKGFFFGEGPFASSMTRVTHALGIEYTPQSVRQALTGIGGIAQFISRQVEGILANVLSAIYHGLIMLVLVFYLLIDGPQLKRFVFRLSPLPDDEEEVLVSKFRMVGNAILFGNGIGCLMQGTLAGMAMALVGLPNALFFGTVMSLFAFLPFVGISIVYIPATIYLLLNGRYAAALFFFAFCSAESFLIENLVKPRLIGSQMRIHNLLIFLSILGGLGVYGVLGILYGPLIVAIFLTFCELYEKRYRGQIIKEE